MNILYKLMRMMRNLPPPPVPQRLREIYKDHPEYIESIQQRLNELVNEMDDCIPPFEQAIWALEGETESFIFDAQDLIEAAQASGDSDALQQAEKMLDLAFAARSSNNGLRGLRELYDYFETHKGAFS